MGYFTDLQKSDMVSVVKTSTITDILLDQSILPVSDDFELLPVKCEGVGGAYDYPEVVYLKPVPEALELLKEAQKHLELIGNCYIQERVPYLDQRVSVEEVKTQLAAMGFVKGQYQNFSLTTLGTNRLRDFIGPVTRTFFEALGVEVFRQKYALANEGWSTQLHRDFVDHKKHGFRGMVPLRDSVYMGYEKNLYRLDVGHLYFVNVARMHRGFTLGDGRLNMFFQMTSDRLILESIANPLAPIKDLSRIPDRYLTTK